MAVQVGDLVRSRNDDDMIMGMIVGKIKSNMSSWIGNSHAAKVAAGNTNVYYVLYNNGRIAGPVFAIDIIAI